MGVRRIMEEKKPELPRIIADRATFDRVCKVIRKNNVQEISFEFIIGSLFPEVYTNMIEALRLQHAQGYAEGLADAEKDQE